MAQVQFQLTLHEVLKREPFEDVKVLTAIEERHRPISWVHVMEIQQVGHLLNGQEMILSTGYGWSSDPEAGLCFLQQLISSGASCLCVELGSHLESIPSEMIKLAEDSSFPILVFEEEVRFVDITKDLHTLLLSQTNNFVPILDKIAKSFHKQLLSNNGISGMLKNLHSITKKQVIYRSTEGEFIAFPPQPETETKFNLHRIDEDQPNAHENYASRSVYVLNHPIAELYMQSPASPLTHVEHYALEQCAAAVSQELMKELYLKEKQHNRDEEWIHDMLTGNAKESDIRNYLAAYVKGELPSTYVCVFELPQYPESTRLEQSMVQHNIIARSIFTQEGYTLISTILNDQLVYILLNKREHASRKERLKRGISRLQQLEDNSNFQVAQSNYGIGQEVNTFEGLRDGFRSAIETIKIQKKIGPIHPPFYEDLHIYRFLAAQEHDELGKWINTYLQSLLAYDEERNSQLLKTLKIYLGCSCSKKETAEALFVSRQSLYPRIEKISELLGDDFMSPHKRTAIELSLFAYEYLYGPIT